MRLELSMIRLDENKIITLDEPDYGEIKRDDNDGRECFITRTHFRGKDKKFYSPAFKIFLDDGETDDYTLAYSADEDNKNFFHRAGNFFYDPSTGKELDEASVGAINPGVTYIHILKDGKPYGRPRRLLILPSSMSLEEYKTMVKDLIFIQRELVQNSKSKSSLSESFKPLCDANNWGAVLEHLKKHIAELTIIMQRIDAHPRYGLRRIQKFSRPANIRHFDEKILRQYCQFPSKEKYRVSDEEISFNIFENRLLKKKLKYLKSFIKSKDSRQQKIYGVTESNIFYKIAQYLKVNSDLPREELISQWQERKNNEEKIHVDYESNIKKWQTEFENLWLENFSIPEPSERRIFIKCHKISISKEKLLLEWLYKFEEKTAYFEIEINGVNRRFYLNTLRLSASKIPQRIAFWSAISKLTSLQEINEISIIGKISMTSKDEVNVESISYMSLNGKQIVVDRNFIDSKDFELFQEEYVTVRLERKYEGHLQNYQQIISLESQFYLNESHKQTDSALDDVVKNLNKCLALDFFKKVDDANEKWRMTQIFTNEPNYHRAYIKLHELDEIFDFSFEVGENKILNEKTDKIYEYWVLAKILEFLIVKQGWQTVDGENNHIKIFRNFFSDFNPNLKFQNRPPIRLKHVVKNSSVMDLEIFYDTQIKFSLGAQSDKRPDFLFKVTLGDDTKFFILDAKYRNYSDMSSWYWREKDLKGVCEKKYIAELKEECGVEISAALIVHTDKSRSENDTKILGKYVQFNGLKNSYQQIGSFYLLPQVEEGGIVNQSDENLTAFFQMIFEYYMDEWEICWQCGSENVQRTTLTTEGNNKKYHYQCSDCGAFWVKNHCKNNHHKIIKHFVNYHEEKGGRWLVTCPICGD